MTVRTLTAGDEEDDLKKYHLEALVQVVDGERHSCVPQASLTAFIL